MSKVLITGPARSGTTLLLLLSQFFKNCRVYTDEEKQPIARYTWKESDRRKHTIIKQPYGFYEEFTPKYLFKDLLAEDWKIICLIRDPRDTLTSFSQKEGKENWCPPKSWIRTARELLANEGDSSLFALRYEDLVQDPVSVMNDLASFLEVPIKDGFERFYETAAAVDKAGFLNGARKIDTDSVGRWKDKKHTEYLSIVITDEIRELSRKLGYDI